MVEERNYLLGLGCVRTQFYRHGEDTAVMVRDWEHNVGNLVMAGIDDWKASDIGGLMPCFRWTLWCGLVPVVKM